MTLTVRLPDKEENLLERIDEVKMLLMRIQKRAD